MAGSQARRRTDIHSLKKKQEKKNKEFYALIRQKSHSPKTISVPVGAGLGTGNGSNGFVKTSGDTMIGSFAFYPKVQTIASGVLDVDPVNNNDTSRIIVAGELGVDDDIDTITGASHAGQILNLQSVETQTHTLKHNTGNFYSYTLGDVTFTGNILLIFNSINNKWIELTSSSASGGAGVTEAQNPVVWTGIHSFNGTATSINSATIVLGDAIVPTFDKLWIYAHVATGLYPFDDAVQDFGSATLRWNQIYGASIIASTVTASVSLTCSGTTFLGIDTADRITCTGRFNADLDPSVTNTYNFGNSGLSWNNMYAANTISNTVTAAVTLTCNGATFLGTATSDTVTFGGRVNSDIVPSTDNTRSLGTAALEWKDLYVDGTAELDNVNARGTVTCFGIVSLSGSVTSITSANIVLGDSSTDQILVVGRFTSDLDPSATQVRNLGSTSLRWGNIFGKTLNVDANSSTASAITIPNGGGIIDFDANAISIGATAGFDALPAKPVAFINIEVGGADYRIPYYSP